MSTRGPEHWGTSVGRAKGGGRSSKTKGRRAAVEVRDLLVTVLGLAEDDVKVKVTTEPGEDLHFSASAREACPLAIEVKNSESLNIWKALGQSASNAPAGTEPAVFFRRAGTPLFVAVRATWLVEQLRRLRFAEPPTSPQAPRIGEE